jgi:hypothetical protein
MLLFTWLAELELEKTVSKAHPTAWRQSIRAEAECAAKAMFDFGGLTEEGKKAAAQKIAHKTCLRTAQELGVLTPQEVR